MEENLNQIKSTERETNEAGPKKIVFKVKKETVVTFILLVLIAVSAFQTFQLLGLSQKIKSGVLKPATAATGQSQNGGNTPLPSNLQNLPNMVGGC